MMAESGYGFAELHAAMISLSFLGVNIQYKKEIGNRERIPLKPIPNHPHPK